MDFFLHQIAARILAIYLCVDSIRTLKLALAEGKIRYHSSDWIDLLLNWSDRFTYRDRSPGWFWIQFGLQVSAVCACIFVVIFGWHAAVQP